MTRLLVFEHSKSVRNNLCERLEFEGYSTVAVETPQAAADALEAGQTDLIIVDDVESLPESDIPFIVISGKSSLDSAVEALRRGAVDYLTKPVDMNRQIGREHV